MIRSLALFLALSALVSSPALAQRLPIGGTNAEIALPPGCSIAGPGTIACGTETVSLGGSSLTYDELVAAHRAAGHVVNELPRRPRMFITETSGGRMLFVRDGADERLFALGTTSAPGGRAGETFAHVFLALAPPEHGAIVSGFEHLRRDSLPYPTVYWNDGSLAFTTSAIETGGGLSGTRGFLRRTQHTTMATLCDNRSITDRLPSRLVLRHQRELSEAISVCEEAFIVRAGDHRVLAAQFGYVFPDGDAYSLTMTYGLTGEESEHTCLEGFEHFALERLGEVIGLHDAAPREASSSEPRPLRPRHAAARRAVLLTNTSPR